MGVSTLDRVGAIGKSLSGCLDWSSLHVSSVCGATPGEVKTWQALLLLLIIIIIVQIICTLLFTSLFQYIYAPDNKRFMAEELS